MSTRPSRHAANSGWTLHRRSLTTDGPDGDRPPAEGGGSIDAGEFSAWLDAIAGAIRGENESKVPCGTCTACCTASQFVHIAPDETDTLAHIPSELLFPAPRMPVGHFVLGYDERGHCPMLVRDRCSVYEHRPRACRAYDCRVFAAGGVAPSDPAQAQIAARVHRWSFRFSSEHDDAAYASVRAASDYLVEHDAELRDEFGAFTPAQLSLLAILLRDQFPIAADEPGSRPAAHPREGAVRVELRRHLASLQKGATA